jgi:hypothetical protein
MRELDPQAQRRRYRETVTDLRRSFCDPHRVLAGGIPRISRRIRDDSFAARVRVNFARSTFCKGERDFVRRTVHPEDSMSVENPRKCALPGCTCSTNSEKYCGMQCEAMEKTSDIDFRCGHPACNGNWHEPFLF